MPDANEGPYTIRYERTFYCIVSPTGEVVDMLYPERVANKQLGRLNSAYAAGHAAGKAEADKKDELRPLCGVTADGVSVRLGDPIWGHFMDRPSFAYQGNERYIAEYYWSDPNHPDRQQALAAHKKGEGK